MDDDTLEQRIRYLIEHGGLYDDPLADLRRSVKWITAAIIALVLVDLATLLV
jgi:hypothetical protein